MKTIASSYGYMTGIRCFTVPVGGTLVPPTLDAWSTPVRYRTYIQYRYLT